MFNENIKQKFIQYKDETVILWSSTLKALFNRTEPFEEKLNKDVCNFTVSEITNMFKTLDYYSYNSLAMDVSRLSQYTNWCMTKGLSIDNQNHFMEITPKTTASLINKKITEMRVVSRDDVLEWCMEIPNPSDQFILLGLFEGINGKQHTDYIDLTIHDFDFEKHTVNLPGRGRINISGLLCEFAIDANDTLNYYSLNTSETASGRKWSTELVENGKIIKEQHNNRDDVSDFRRGRRIDRRVYMMFRWLDIEKYMSANTLINSGIIWYVNERAKQLNISGEEFISTHPNEIIHQFDKVVNKKPFMYNYGEFLV